MNIWFTYISDPSEAPAIKAFSHTILHNFSEKYPEINNEHRIVIEEKWEHESAAFKSHAKKILRIL